MPTSTPYDDMFPLWRIRQIGNGPPAYYNANTAEFVAYGTGFYSIFSNKQKVARFGVVDQQRNWESFGWRIPLYDEGEEPPDGSISSDFDPTR